MNDWLSHEGLIGEALRRREQSEDVCIATLIASKGSVPQDLGAKILISRCSDPWGTIGGGKVEASVIAHARTLLQEPSMGPMEVKTWNLQKDLGMSCGGEVTVLFEVIVADPPLALAVFGAGHIAQALIPFLLKLNARIYWFDDRPEWLQRGPQEGGRLKKFQLQSFAEVGTEVAKLPSAAFILSITKGHATDIEVLRSVLRFDFPFVGVIGSKTKALALRKQLLEEGHPSGKVEKFFCPVGEPFGSNDPHEIAFSIVAQILKTRDQLGAIKSL